MKRIFLTLAIIILMYYMGNAQESKLLSSGVLIAKESLKKASILNTDGSTYLIIIKGKDELIVRYSKPETGPYLEEIANSYYPFYMTEHKRYGAPIPSVLIRAFYQDDGIIVLDAKKTKVGYDVFVNGHWKTLPKQSSFLYKDWNIFLINHVHIKGDRKLLIHVNDSEKSPMVASNSDYSYKITDIKKDWIKIECLKQCEGCPNNKITTGWIKWRKGNLILINLSYSC